MERLKNILYRCRERQNMDREDVIFLLNRTKPQEVEEIYRTAREVRDAFFHEKVFLYGFIYFSTHCQNDCTFCYYRKDNERPRRYRKTLDEIVKTAKELKRSGVHLVDLTTGDDPYYTKHPKRLGEIIRVVKKETGLPIMVSPGLLDMEGICQVKEAGADWYALYQETHDRSLFRRLRMGQDYEARMNAKRCAVKRGLLIEEGLLTRVGDTAQNKADSFMEMERIQASQVRAMTFIPQKGAPLSGQPVEGFRSELLNIAVMRLLFPDKLIPASLDVEGLKGLGKRLMAGANVVTSIIPPREGYAGVANSEGDIDEGYRTVQGIQETLSECQVFSAGVDEYKKWVEKEKRRRGCIY